jgi:hypothetical protein
LAIRFFWGGIILVLISGITQWILRAGFSSLTDFQRPSIGGIIFNVLVYFTLGLVLLSQARLTRLLVGWETQKVPVTSGLVKQWAKYGLLFLGVITLVAFILPTGYSLGFLASAAVVIGYLLGLLMFIFELLTFLIFLPFLWLFSLLGQSTEERSPPPLPPAPFTSPAEAGTPAPSWFEAVRSLIFWLVAIGMAWYLVKIYLNDHPELRQMLKSFKPVGLTIRLLKQLWAHLLRLAQTGLEMIPKKTILPEQQRGVPAPVRRWNWFGLRRLAPRERILSYYLNILKRAEKCGPARKAHQTPYEYEPDLSRSVPDVQPEVDALTQAFVQARYSQKKFDEEQATLVKQQWRQIRRKLQKRGRKSRGGKPESH